MEAYLQGLTMGLAYVAPIGLQNLFVINTALTQKRSRAYLTALIVIFFDVTLAFACFFGIGAIMQRFEWLRMAVLLVGSGIVIWIGIGLLRDRGPEDTAAAVDVPWAKVVTTACVVTWFNPQAIIDGTMMAGAFHAALPAGESTRFILGVTSASCLWFTGVTTVLQLAGPPLQPERATHHQPRLRQCRHFLRRKTPLVLSSGGPSSPRRIILSFLPLLLHVQLFLWYTVE